MDSFKSQWIKFTSEERILPTSKIFYNKYLYKVALYVPCASFLISTFWSGTTIDDLQSRIDSYKNYEKSMMPISWNHRRLVNQIDNVNTTQLIHIFDLMTKFNGLIKTRVEQNKLTVYTETPEVLTQILSYSDYIYSAICEIYAPESDSKIDQLRNNTIFMQNPAHKFKVDIKECRYTETEKLQICNYVDQHPTAIFLVDTMERRLRNGSKGYLHGYFYIDDESLLMFLKMICPKFVRTIYKLERRSV